jgi:hypothetical protein
MMTEIPSAKSNTRITEKPNHPEDHPGDATSTDDSVRLGEYSPETSEGNQLPILQKPLLLDTSGIPVPDVTESPGTDMKNKASMFETIDGTIDPNSCIPSIRSTLFTSDTSVTSPPELNSEDGSSAESEEQVDELSADTVSERCSENPVVSGKSASNEDPNDSAVLQDSREVPATQVVKMGDGNIEPNETERVSGTPHLTSENQIATLSASVLDGETIIENQTYLRSPMLVLCRPPISPISPAIKEKFSQSPSVVEPNGESDLIDNCNNSSSPAVDDPTQMQTTVDIPLTNDTPTKTMDQDSPDEEDRTTQFDDDKERLKSFLLRIQASKANKQTNLTRRESLQNRHDSDVIRKALASPRFALEEKDANTSSPTRLPSLHELSKQLESVISDVEDRDVVTHVENQPAAEGVQDISSGSPNLRRSTRKQSRIPQLPTASTTARTPRKINVRRIDGNETLVLAAKKEAQEFAQLTRTNTRKNKGGAIPALQRLTQLTSENLVLSPNITDTQRPSQDSVNTREENNETDKKRTVHWDETLTYFKAAPVSIASPTPSNEPDSRTQPTQDLSTPQSKKTSSSRVRRLKGLGAANGTPAKGLLSTTLLPDEVAEQKEVTAGENESLIKPRKAALGKNHPDKKSRLEPSKKLELKPSVASVNGGVVGAQIEGKENVVKLRVVSPRKGTFVGGRVIIPIAATGAGVGTGDGGIVVVPTRKRAARKI